MSIIRKCDDMSWVNSVRQEQQSLKISKKIAMILQSARAENERLNAGIFDGTIPVAMRVERVTDEDDEQVKKHFETKNAFSASGLWN